MKTEIKLARILDSVLALARVADEEAYKTLLLLKNRKFEAITMSKIMKHYRLFKAMDNSYSKYELREDYYILEKVISNKRKTNNSENNRIRSTLLFSKRPMAEKYMTTKNRIYPLPSHEYWRLLG